MNQINEKAAPVHEEISIKDLLSKLNKLRQYLLSNWVALVIVGAIGGVVGLTYAIIKKPIYKAELSFALEDEKSSSGGLGAAMGLASQFGIDLGGGSGGGAFSGDNLLELMKSRSMVEKTLLTPISVNGKVETLAELYMSFNDLHNKWAERPGLRDVKFLPNLDRTKFTILQDSVLGVFYKKIVAENLIVDKVDKKLSIITVKVNSTNELFSKHFSEVLTKTVSDFYVATKTKRSVQNVKILQHQTDSVRHELNAAITGVASYADVNPNPNPALQILRTPSQRRQVDVQANQAILTQLVTNLELSKMSLRKETPLIQIIDSPILPLEKDRVGKTIGLVAGGVIAGLLVVAFLSIKWVFRE